MARDGYVKQVWEDGVSPVNAERLNKMEYGIELGVNLAWNALDNAGGSGGSGGGAMVVNVTMNSENTLTADRTLDEIVTAAQEGKFVWIYSELEGNLSIPLSICMPGQQAVFCCMVMFQLGTPPSLVVFMIKADGTVGFNTFSMGG